MITWIDSHNHLQDPRLEKTDAVIAEMKKAGMVRCVVNATREDDWEAVEKLAIRHPDFILPAFGIHPWQAHTAREGWQDRLRNLLEKHPSSSIGECGLDRWISTPEIDVQMPIFCDQLRLARELDRPVTIHCLKAWGPLFDAFDQQSPPVRFLMHSFGGPIEIAERLLPLGAYFSFSGYFLHPRKAGVLEVFKQLPKDRILIETDAPDMLPPEQFITQTLGENRNHPANLPAITGAFATALGISEKSLADLTAENFRRCFRHF